MYKYIKGVERESVLPTQRLWIRYINKYYEYIHKDEMNVYEIYFSH